jgi:hypothetical protein
MRSKLFYGLSATLLVALFLFSTAYLFAQEQPPGETPPNTTLPEIIEDTGVRTGFDPLSVEEQDKVLAVAAANPQLGEWLAGTKRAEILLLERHDESKEVVEKGEWPRRADIFVYGYGIDATAHLIVNLMTGNVDSFEVAQSLQLPLTLHETSAVLQIALAHPEAGAIIRRQYQQATGEELRDLSQVQPFAFIPAEGIGECGLHRCGQLVLLTATHVVLGADVVVDLSTEQVIHLVENQW